MVFLLSVGAHVRLCVGHRQLCRHELHLLCSLLQRLLINRELLCDLAEGVVDGGRAGVDEREEWMVEEEEWMDLWPWLACEDVLELHVELLLVLDE